MKSCSHRHPNTQYRRITRCNGYTRKHMFINNTKKRSVHMKHTPGFSICQLQVERDDIGLGVRDGSNDNTTSCKRRPSTCAHTSRKSSSRSKNKKTVSGFSQSTSCPQYRHITSFLRTHVNVREQPRGNRGKATDSYGSIMCRRSVHATKIVYVSM